MRTLNSYLIHHTPPDVTQSPNISSGTLDALENAEKLVQEARQTIIEASYSVPTLDFTAERQPTTTDVDEDELYIRDIVTAQFQKANGRISSNTIFSSNARTNLEFNSPSRVRRIISRETMETTRERCRETKKKMETCKECLISKDENKLRGKMSLGAFHGRESARVDIKPQLSLRNVGRLDLFPSDTNSKTSLDNVKTYQFEHESPNRASVDESLVDAAVQTSLCESTVKESNVSTKEPTELPVTGGQSSTENQVSHQNTIENGAAMHPEISDQANGEEKRVEETKTKGSKGSFLDFLQYVAQLEENKDGNAENNEGEAEDSVPVSEHSEDEVSDDNFDPREIDLDFPNLKEIDDIINRLDIKMKKICADIDEFNNEYLSLESQWEIDDSIPVKYVDKNTSPITVSKDDEPSEKRTNLKKQGREKSGDARASVKFLLRPRSRISSTDSEESSDTMLPPARYSTPLNNYRPVDIPAGNAEVKNSRDTMDELFIPITEPDMKNDASKVIMTKNKFSSVSSMDENSPKDERNNDAININIVSHSIADDTKKNTVQDVQSNTSHESQKVSKSSIDNSEKRVDNEDVNETDIDYEIEIGEQSLSIVISSDNKSTTTNSQESSKHKNESNGIGNPHDSCATLKSECGNLNMNEENRRGEEETKSIVNSDKTNQTPPELSTRERTSLDISPMYSGSFETSSISKMKSISKDIINVDDAVGEKVMSENRIESQSVNGAINNAKKIEKPIETSPFYLRENKTDSLLSQLSKSSNFNHIKSSGKTENGRNSNTSSPSSSSLRKISSINSLSSSQNSNGLKKKFIADDCYSEGELYLPSSCSYSLGEIRIAERDQQNNINKTNISHCPITFLSSISSSSVQSPGEILETDIESNFTIEKEY